MNFSPQSMYVIVTKRNHRTSTPRTSSKSWKLDKKIEKKLHYLLLEIECGWRTGDNPKLQQKYVGPYRIRECYPNHTYKIERQGQFSVQNECRLKLYHACDDEVSQAPATLEPRRRPTMRWAIHNQIMTIINLSLSSKHHPSKRVDSNTRRNTQEHATGNTSNTNERDSLSQPPDNLMIQKDLRNINSLE